MNNREFGGGSSSQACASCKHQRKKCDQNCELAPYFRASRYREFRNAQKLFGVSNIQKIINSIEPHQRQAAAESILMEGNIRYKDPVHGSLGVVRKLKSHIEFYSKEHDAVNQQLAFFREREKQQNLENFLKGSSVAVPPLITTPSRSTFGNYETAGFNSQAPNLPHKSTPNIGDMKVGERKYNYKSIMEESAVVQSFDIQSIDQFLDPYQTGVHALQSSDIDEPENSKVQLNGSGKQPSESVSERGGVCISSLKGKKQIGH